MRVSAPPDLRPYLRTLDAETLVDLLYAQARRDPELRHSLELRCATQSGEVAEAHRLLDTAVQDGNVEYTAKVGAVLDTLERLLDAGSPADLAPLARRTVDDIGEVLEQSGDPSGDLGDKLDFAVELYARACVARPPDPEQLAEWLLEVEFDGPGRPTIALADFAEALGEKGLERVKSTVDEILTAGPTGYRRDVAERLLEELAEVRGDVDALVAILSAKPPRVDVSLKIVRVLRAAGRTTEAVAYAARALGGDSRPPQPLVEAPAVASTETGTEASTETGTALLALPAPGDMAAADELIRTLLGDGRPDEAWAAAQRYACSPPVRLELAALREAEHPADALAVYQAHIDRLIEQKGADRYEEAARWLRKVRALHRKAGTAGEFAEYLAGLVTRHKRKVRLLDELRRARIALPGPRS